MIMIIIIIIKIIIIPNKCYARECAIPDNPPNSTTFSLNALVRK